MKAILFGSIGVFCDSSELQRQAFNDAFTEMDLDWYWDAPHYKKLLLAPGGLTRIARFASEYDTGLKIDFKLIHKRKTELYAEKLELHKQTIRSGVVRLIKAARAQGIKVAWVTSTEYSNLEAIIRRSEGMLSASDFDVITYRDTVDNEKPDPSPYLKALAQLEIDAEHAVAIEDTAACMRSAYRADVACLVTPHRYSLDQDYYEAIAVVSALGDPGLEAKSLSGAQLLDKRGMVTINALKSITEGTVLNI